VSELLTCVRVHTVASKHATRGVPIVVVLMCASPVPPQAAVLLSTHASRSFRRSVRTDSRPMTLQNRRRDLVRHARPSKSPCRASKRYKERTDRHRGRKKRKNRSIVACKEKILSFSEEIKKREKKILSPRKRNASIGKRTPTRAKRAQLFLSFLFCPDPSEKKKGTGWRGVTCRDGD
jgi:hypothetical protein